MPTAWATAHKDLIQPSQDPAIQKLVGGLAHMQGAGAPVKPKPKATGIFAGKPDLNTAAPSVHVALAVQHCNLDASEAAAARSAALQALDAASQQAGAARAATACGDQEAATKQRTTIEFRGRVGGRV